MVETAALRRAIERGTVERESEVVATHHRLARTPIPVPDGPDGHTDEWTQARVAFHTATMTQAGEPHVGAHQPYPTGPQPYSAEAGMCTDPDASLSMANFGPNQKYTGTIELVVPEASGTLILAPAGMMTGGWEWNY
ncbi:FCD domain-containing protein [Prauserella cavernicola]|uniref:FCD domain-containing protein n=1 Tax=Prauserella cavernicola TaxID=2800127 RepID=A0A934QW29_9PSEU|nr:FCD domain-containing protein [Prauserella cavernicola]